jgi:hypothetical protein
MRRGEAARLPQAGPASGGNSPVFGIAGDDDVDEGEALPPVTPPPPPVPVRTHSRSSRSRSRSLSLSSVTELERLSQQPLSEEEARFLREVEELEVMEAALGLTTNVGALLAAGLERRPASTDVTAAAATPPVAAPRTSSRRASLSFADDDVDALEAYLDACR